MIQTTLATIVRSSLVLAISCSWALADEQTEPVTRTVTIKGVTLVIPKAWEQKPPSNRLRLAQFDIPAVKGDEEGTELVISSFGGSGGGVAANVQRWIGQFDSKGRTSKITRGESEQGEYVVVELSGTYNKPIGPPVLRKTEPTPGQRMVGVILNAKGTFYFLKMTGSDKTVAAATQPLRASFGGDAEKEKPLETE